MLDLVSVRALDPAGLRWAQTQVAIGHYLHSRVDPRCSVEGYGVYLADDPGPVGCLLFGRPQAQRVGGWYGSVEDVASGRCRMMNTRHCGIMFTYVCGYCYEAGCVHGHKDGSTHTPINSEGIKL